MIQKPSVVLYLLAARYNKQNLIIKKKTKTSFINIMKKWQVVVSTCYIFSILK